ncbi:unnamed protein product [Closterium sp. Naga37s-1]|nr:unnamed protein product [Closterium sp. Naga37s-1]
MATAALCSAPSLSASLALSRRGEIAGAQQLPVALSSAAVRTGAFDVASLRKQRGHHGLNVARQPVQARAGEKPSSSAEPSDASRVASTVAGKAVAAVLAAIQVLAPVSAAFVLLLAQPPAAEAILLSPDTKVPRNADVALRRAVPVVNEAVRKIQDELEEISTLMRIPQKKPYKTMQANVNKAVKLAEANQVAILDAVPAADKERAAAIYNDLVNSKSGFPGLLAAIEDKDPDRVSIRLASSLNDVANLSLLQATGLQFLIPNQYASLPRLTGRATVEFAVLKADGSYFSLDNGATSALTGVVQVVLDGYSAPLTAGNFAQLVSRRAYDGVAVKATDLAVLSDARDPSAGRDVPLEIMPAGEFQPIYRTPLDVQDGELPVLPMSVFGAMVMAHSPETDSFSHPSQFFLYKYDKRRSGLGGLAFDEGQFSVFGPLQPVHASPSPSNPLEPAPSPSTALHPLHQIELEQYPTGPHIASRMLYEIHTRFDDVEGRTVLDLGCGCGTLGIAAAMLGAEYVVGVDADDSAIATAQANCQEYEVRRSSLSL